MKEIAEQKNIEQIKEKAKKYLMSLGNNLKEEQKNQFIEISIAYNLNPFKREIYGIPYGSNFNIIVGYEVYLKRAEKSGKLSGWNVITNGEGKDLKAICTVHRKDWSTPLVHEVFLSEYSQGKSALWNSKPLTMIKKVAIAQAFRLAFPCDLGGMPYTSEEFPNNTKYTNPIVVTPPIISDDRFNDGIQKYKKGIITLEILEGILSKCELSKSQEEILSKIKNK